MRQTIRPVKRVTVNVVCDYCGTTVKVPVMDMRQMNESLSDWHVGCHGCGRTVLESVPTDPVSDTYCDDGLVGLA